MERPAAAADTALGRFPLASALQDQWRRVLGLLVIVLGLLVIYNAAISTIAPYARSSGGVSQSGALTAVTIAQGGYLLSIIVSSALSDRFGRRRVVAAGVVGACVVMFGLFPLIDAKGFGGLLIGTLLLLLFLGAWWGPLGAYMAELFDAGHRYSGLSLAYQVAATLSAFGPVLITLILGGTGSSLLVAIGTAGLGAIGLVCLWRLPETGHRPLDIGATPAARSDFMGADGH